jgi:cobalt-precorrin-5B (C1)-methyltransferase
MEILAAHAGAVGVPAEMLAEILECVACDDVLRILQDTPYYEKTLSRVTNRVAFHLQHRGDEMETGTLLFSKEYGILGKTEDADALLKKVLG